MGAYYFSIPNNVATNISLQLFCPVNVSFFYFVSLRVIKIHSQSKLFLDEYLTLLSLCSLGLSCHSMCFVNLLFLVYKIFVFILIIFFMKPIIIMSITIPIIMNVYWPLGTLIWYYWCISEFDWYSFTVSSNDMFKGIFHCHYFIKWFSL